MLERIVKENSDALIRLLDEDYKALNLTIGKLLNSSENIVRRLHDSMLAYDGIMIFVEVKNTKTLARQKQHVLRELLVDAYLQEHFGVKIVWHLSERRDHPFFNKLLGLLDHFGIEYWIGSDIPTPQQYILVSNRMRFSSFSTRKKSRNKKKIIIPVL